MAEKIKFTRPELKRQRDLLARFRRYLPMLKLKQQQLQIARRIAEAKQARLEGQYVELRAGFQNYAGVMKDFSGINWREFLNPAELRTRLGNVAGVKVPVFESVAFADAAYSLWSTPVWVDGAVKDLRALKALRLELDVVAEELVTLRREFNRTMQRVNLFEKVKIPGALEAMRVIRIHLGDEMTAAVGRAKIAKAKVVGKEQAQ